MPQEYLKGVEEIKEAKKKILDNFDKTLHILIEKQPKYAEAAKLYFSGALDTIISRTIQSDRQKLSNIIEHMKSLGQNDYAMGFNVALDSVLSLLKDNK